tara:strand:+ start:4870 stop:5346 length:477 start_codon:yes stop_codon:yes gene_type:complete
MANINGWGRGTWGQLGFGSDPLPVTVTGNVGTTALDDGTAVQAAAVAGVTATTSTSGLGDESVSAAANVSVTGNAGTSAVGNESLITNNFLDMTGLAGTSALGIETVTADADVSVQGFDLTSSLNNNVNVWSQEGTNLTVSYSIISTAQTPNYSEIVI